MFRLEQDLIALMNDSTRTSHKFLPMTSYHRMIVHRCAAFFGEFDQSCNDAVVNMNAPCLISEDISERFDPMTDRGLERRTALQFMRSWPDFRIGPQCGYEWTVGYCLEDEVEPYS